MPAFYAARDERHDPSRASLYTPLRDMSGDRASAHLPARYKTQNVDA